MIAACASLLLPIMDQLIGRSALPSCMSVEAATYSKADFRQSIACVSVPTAVTQLHRFAE